MDKQFLLALTLSLAVLFGWRYFLEKTQPPAAPMSSPVVATPVAPPTPSQSSSAPVVSKLALAASLAAEIKKAEAEKSYEVETGLYRIVLSNREAVVKSWVLKKYADSNGKPLELVNAEQGSVYGFPLSLNVPKKEDAPALMKNALFASNGPEKINLSNSHQAAQSLEFEYNEAGLRVVKKLTFTPGSYSVDIECKVWINGEPADYQLFWKSGFGDLSADRRTAIHEAVFCSKGSVTRYKADKVKKQVDSQVEQGQKEQRAPAWDWMFQGAYQYAGLDDHYFAGFFRRKAET